jgi:hypothetical protein
LDFGKYGSNFRAVEALACIHNDIAAFGTDQVAHLLRAMWQRGRNAIRNKPSKIPEFAIFQLDSKSIRLNRGASLWVNFLIQALGWAVGASLDAALLE